MDLLEKATLVAITAHEAAGQKRKFTNLPYWYHPSAVADCLSQHTDDEELIAAGWLHDVVEDTHLDVEHIRSHFGNNVAQYVGDVTKQYPYGEEDSRNTLAEIKRLMAVCAKSQLLKLCDIRCNIKDITPECGFPFISEWLPKKIAAVLAIKHTTPEHGELCDNIINLARTMVRVHFPNTSVVRLYANGVNLFSKAINFNPEEETANV